MTTRRTFLHSAAGTLAGLLSVSPGEAQPASPLVDTHTHFYDPTRPRGVPWPGKDDRLLYRRVMPEQFVQVARPLGVTGTVVVEASPWVEDNQWLLDLAARHPVVLGVVGRLAPDDDHFARHLRRFARNPLFRGLRLNHDELRKQAGQRRLRDALGLLATDGLALDVNGGPDLPADVAGLARQFDTLRFVINHGANVRIDGKAVPAAWLRGMRSAARQRNVFCKVSALVEGTGRRQGDAPRDVNFYRPVLDALWETFGEDRLLFGSNWPVSERFASYATVLGIVRDYFRAKGQAAQDKFFHRNAHAAYRWPRR